MTDKDKIKRLERIIITLVRNGYSIPCPETTDLLNEDAMEKAKESFDKEFNLLSIQNQYQNIQRFWDDIKKWADKKN